MSRLYLNKSKVGEFTTKSGREFHSLIAEGKKDDEYAVVLAVSCINLLLCPRVLTVDVDNMCA